jgi:hypothetical protein
MAPTRSALLVIWAAPAVFLSPWNAEQEPIAESAVCATKSRKLMLSGVGLKAYPSSGIFSAAATALFIVLVQACLASVLNGFELGAVCATSIVTDPSINRKT